LLTGGCYSQVVVNSGLTVYRMKKVQTWRNKMYSKCKYVNLTNNFHQLL
jgi:hypothetical protein